MSQFRCFIRQVAGLFFALLLLAASPHLFAQTIYATVLGNQEYVVGSSTLHSGLFRSTDAGHTWAHLGPENLKTYSFDAVDSAKGRILFIAAGNGVHRSLDSGRTWKIVTGWQMTEVLDIRIDQAHPQQIYAATAWGIWYSSDGGDHWNGSQMLIRPSYTYRLGFSAQGKPIALTYALMTTTDGGRSWRLDYTPDDSNALAPLAHYRAHTGYANFHREVYDLSVQSNSTILATDSGVFQRNGSAVTDISYNLKGKAVHAVASAGGTVLAGTFGDGIYRREGDSWVPSGLEGSQIWRLIAKEY